MSAWTLHPGDCLDVLASMPDASVDSVVTDPPYGLGFMGKAWDALPPGEIIAKELLRVLKPGGHLLAFGGTRTVHRLACALEDAGFEIRDSLVWMYGSGFPKSLDVSKAIDREAGAENIIGTQPDRWTGKGNSLNFATDRPQAECKVTAPATDAARQWAGWGTALKPAHEPIILARKPLAGTVAANVSEHGTGALNVDGCRVGTMGGTRGTGLLGIGGNAKIEPIDAGRWPPNVLLGHHPLCGRARLVDLESPFAGDITANVEYARRCMADSLSRGEHPIASHLLYTQPGILDDGVAEERRRGIDAGKAWGAIADTTVVYMDRGVSDGMKYGIEHAQATGRRIVRRWLDAPERTDDIGCAPMCPVAELDRQSGELASGSRAAGTYERVGYHGDKGGPMPAIEGDSGGASRFFPRFRYVAKASTGEREAGLEGGPKRQHGMSGGAQGAIARGEEYDPGIGLNRVREVTNHHPTVKPIDLMRWLCRLITPPGGLVLDPFAGSGTTGIAALREGMRFVGIEREAEYVEIARARIEEDAPLFNRETA